MIGERYGTSENERVSFIASELVLWNVNGSCEGALISSQKCTEFIRTGIWVVFSSQSLRLSHYRHI